MNTGVAAFWAGGWDWISAPAGVAAHLVLIGMENEWEIAIIAKGLPATLVTDGERGGAAAVMEDHRLGMIIERLLDTLDESVAKKMAASEVGVVFEVDDSSFGGDRVFDGEFRELDDRIVLFAEVIIGNKRCGGAEDGFGHGGGEAESRVFWILILVIAGFVSLVDNHEAKVTNRGEKRRARANNNLWRGCVEGAFPEMMTDCFSLSGVKNGNVREMNLEVADELRSEGDFRDKNNCRLILCEALFSEFNIDISFAATSDTVQKDGVGSAGVNLFNGAFLGSIERVIGGFGDFRSFYLGVAAVFGDATGEHSLDDAGKGAAIVIAEPKHGLNQMRRQWLVINNACDGFSFEVWLGSFGRNNANCGLLTEGNFDDLADFEGGF